MSKPKTAGTLYFTPAGGAIYNGNSWHVPGGKGLSCTDCKRKFKTGENMHMYGVDLICDACRRPKLLGDPAVREYGGTLRITPPGDK